MGSCPRCHASGKELFSEKRYDKATVDAEFKRMFLSAQRSADARAPPVIPVYTWTYYSCEACDLVWTEMS